MILPPKTKLWQGNVFTPVCDSVSIITIVITSRKHSLRRLCFYRCVSVHKGGVCSQDLLPGDLLLWGCSGGCLLLGDCSGGCLLQGECLLLAGAWWTPPNFFFAFFAIFFPFFSFVLHLFCIFFLFFTTHTHTMVSEQAVHILLECILVTHVLFIHKNSLSCP